MESVDKELSKSIQRHLDSSKLNTEIADQYSSLSCARKKGRKQLHLVAVVVVGGGGGGGAGSLCVTDFSLVLIFKFYLS